MLILVSCEKDVTVKVPPQPVKLVINGITGINTPFSVTVGKTAGILEPTSPQSYQVTNAMVQLYENNLLKDTLVFNVNSHTYDVKHNTIPKPGFTYLINVSAPDFITAESATITPADIIIENVTTRANVRTDADGNMYDEVKIRFTDNASISNYYLINLRRPFNGGNGNIHYEDIYCMHSMDKDIDRRNNADPTDFENCIDREFFMTDKYFNGMSKEMIVFIRHDDLKPVINSFDNREYKAVVELNNITSDHYKYRRSYTAYQDAEENPFAEPVLLFTNVKNGYGIFSTYNLAIDTIR